LVDHAQPDRGKLAFEVVLDYLKESRGFDFTGYKRTSLARRVDRRMAQVGIAGYADYVDYLQVNPEEFISLFNTILINVTGFFRDAETWEYLRTGVVPAIVAAHAPEEQIRIWSAGCASGEEAYSLAIMLAETLGIERYRRQVKIYATDVDDEALAQARHASYAERDVQGVAPQLLERYFDLVGGRYFFRKDLRRSVIFGRNDLVQDAPISRIDLLVCRNTLMYFTPETQAKILGRFHFALTPQGMLFLGKAEMLLSHGRLFDPVDLKQRVFRKVAATVLPPSGFLPPGAPADRRADVHSLEDLREKAFSTSPVAQVTVTADDTVALVNHQAETLFGLSQRDLGRPLRDLEVSYRPVELRGYLEQARAERRAVRVKEVEWARGTADPVWLEIQVNPLIGRDNRLLGVAVVFHDVTAARRLLKELEHAHRQLETAYEELQSTNEELETTNEELQSTVEELETTNEELQSTNEELETMNEELQSANDELQTINDTLRERSTELDELNAFLESVLTSLQAAIVVVDREMLVLAWNRGAEELWGVRPEEARGQHLLNIDIGMPLAELRPHVRAAIADSGYIRTLTVPGVNRRGRDVTVRIVCGALRQPDREPAGAILVMDAVPDGVAAEHQVTENQVTEHQVTEHRVTEQAGAEALLSVFQHRGPGNRLP
jgi:two-component system, chemotaxis family, CheB/CheR fusion protein